MDNSKIIKVIKVLYAKTLAKEVHWDTTQRSNSFVVSFPNYSVELTEDNGEMGIDYWLSIIDDEGETVESVSDNDLSAAFPDAYSVMKQTFAEGRRIAMGVDKALDDILQLLDPDVPF